MTATFFDAAYAASERPVRLADIDPDLFAGCPRDLGEDAYVLRVRTIGLERGPCSDGAAAADDQRLGLLVLDGFLVRTVSLAGQRRSELLGPIDLLRPWDAEQDVTSLASTVRWDALQPVQLAVLDHDFVQAASRWPSILSELVMRGVRRSHRLALQLAIGDIRHIDERLLALFVHLGDRWGRMTTQGVHLPLPLTHDLVAQLVGARRPTVTTALNDLQRAGRIYRLPDRSWLLPRSGPTDRQARSAR